jgi:hypothetical protein
MSSAESPSKLKKVINFILSLLALLKWVPFLGKWRPIILALSTVLGTLSAIKCDPPANKEQPKIDPTTPVPTPVRTPSPSPTPTPQALTSNYYSTEYRKQAGPFSVKYTAPFKYNTHLWVDKWRLQVMGHDSRDGFMIAPSVVLKSAGKRVLTVRDLHGNVLAEVRLLRFEP